MLHAALGSCSADWDPFKEQLLCTLSSHNLIQQLERINTISLGGAVGAGVGGPAVDDDEDEEQEDKIEVQEGESLEEIKAKLKPKKSSISPDMLDTANTYDDKVAVIRMIVGDEAGRVSSVFRALMKQGSKNEQEEN